ncbi:MAG: FAD binding domain-containing protein [Rectinemataceae bacterium]
MIASEVHLPASIPELLELLKRNPQLLLFAGGTGILREKGSRFIDLAPSIALLDHVAELRTVTRTERFVELGSGLRLSEILSFKQGTIAPILREAIAGIANPVIRNLATIGGNLASRERFMDSWSALACLDALLEIREPSGSHWMNVNRLVGETGKPALPPVMVISRIRVPVDSWPFLLVRKLGQAGWPGDDTWTFAALAKVDKGYLVDLRLAMGGRCGLRFPELDSRLEGSSLPLGTKEVAVLVADYREAARELDPDAAFLFSRMADLALGTLR